VGLLLAVMGILCLTVFFPKALDSKIRRWSDIWDATSYGGKAFDSSPMDVQMSFHVFELGNPLDIAVGRKPVTVDTGPYTYK